MKKMITTFVAAFAIAATSFAQTGSIIAPATGFVAKGSNTQIEFQVTAYNAALDADVAKTICTASVAVAGAGASAGAISYSPQAIGNKGAFLLTVPSGAMLGDVVTVTISGITIKNGANPCGTSPISVGDIVAMFTVAADALPIELTSFNGRPFQNNVLLKWTTASEQNNAAFVVERSFNAAKFEKLGEVRGAGSSNVQNVYSFNTPLDKPMAYYRLGAVDYNGDLQYAKIITVFNTSAGLNGGVTAQPQGLQVNLNSTDGGEAALTITDLSGRTLLAQGLELQAGQNEQFINFDAPMGIYVVNINNGKDVVTIKFVKTR